MIVKVKFKRVLNRSDIVFNNISDFRIYGGLITLYPRIETESECYVDIIQYLSDEVRYIHIKNNCASYVIQVK